MPKKLPKMLFVKIEQVGDDEPYFVAAEAMYDLAEMGEKIKIGTYKLVEVSDAEVVIKTSVPRS